MCMIDFWQNSLLTPDGGRGKKTRKKNPFHASGKVKKKTEIPFPPPPALILFCLLRFPGQSILHLSLFSVFFAYLDVKRKWEGVGEKMEDLE